MDASDTGTDVGEHLLLDAGTRGTDVGFFLNVKGMALVLEMEAYQTSMHYKVLDLTSQVTGALGIANGGTALSSGFLRAGLTFYETMRLTGRKQQGMVQLYLNF